MKKIRYLLLIFFMFIITIPDCYAFSKKYKYNYEVTSVDFDGQFGTIEGWAILNAGVTDGSSGANGSPSLDRKYESTKNNPYKYALKIYALHEKTEIKYIEGTAKKIAKPISLYNFLCYRDANRRCVYSRSPEYEKVSFKFSYDFADFNDSTKYTIVGNQNAQITGYKFVLSVSSTKADCKTANCTQTFPLTFLKYSVSESGRKYFDSTTYMDEIYFIANSARIRDKACSEGNVVDKINAGKTYKLVKDVEPTFCKSQGVTFYKFKIGDKKGWAPAPWIAPLEGDYTIIKNDVCDVQGDDMNFKGVTNEVVTDSCISKVNLKDTISDSCITSDQTEYYKITCTDNIDTEFKPSKTKYYRGDDFQLNVKITSSVSCEGEFYHEKWKNDYQRADSNGKMNLQQIKENFKNFSMPNYDFNPSGELKYELSDRPGNIKKINLIVESKNTASEANKNIEYTDATKNVPKKLTYVTNTQVVNMKLVNSLEVDNSKNNIPYTVLIQKAGYSAKSSINFACEIEKIIAIYRPIDLENPFISSDRIIGENWKNSQYDFTGIIDEDIWSNPKPKFVFFVSTKDIENIKRSNANIGISGYTGSNCQNRHGKYWCSFIRDYDYFTNIYIDGEQVEK